VKTFTNDEVSVNEALKARSQLVFLMNNDAELLEEGLDLLTPLLQDNSGESLAKVASTLARVQSQKSQTLIAQEIALASKKKEYHLSSLLLATRNPNNGFCALATNA